MITTRVRPPNASGGILRGMPAFTRHLAIAITLCCLTGCLAHQRKHSVVRIWADWNSYEQCSVCMEELDHKPLRAARVGAFIWAYDKDPGHTGAYAKARRDWEALVAQRVNEATEAANAPGVTIGGGSCEPADRTASVVAPIPTVESAGTPLSNEQLPPMPSDSSAEIMVPTASPPAPHTATTAVIAPYAAAPNVVAPTTRPESLDLPATGHHAVPLQPASPQRLPTALPPEPPGVSIEGPISAANSPYQLSGFNRMPQQSSGTANQRASQSREYRRPAGAWLFSNP